MQEKYLLDLINHTSSMDDQEKQYWKELLPTMKKEHRQKLFDILKTEKQKLDNLEQKYREITRELNERRLQEFERE